MLRHGGEGSGREGHDPDRTDAPTLHVHTEVAGATAIAVADKRVCAIASKTRCFGWDTGIDTPVLAADISGEFVQLTVGVNNVWAHRGVTTLVL